MNKYIKMLLAPETEGASAGGGAAVAEPPPTTPKPAPGSTEPALGEGGDLAGLSWNEAIAKTYRTEPRRRPEMPKKDKPATAEKPATPPAQAKPEEKPASTPPAAEKKPEEKPRRTIFDEPEKKTEEKPAVPSASPGEEIREGDWAAAKEARKKLHMEVDDLKRQLATYHQSAPDVREIERLRQEHKTFSDRIAVLDYQNHPDFVSRFTEPKRRITEEVNRILSDSGVQGFELNTVLSMPRADMAKRLSEVTEKLNSFDQGEFRLAVREYQKLSEAEKAAVANHGDGMKKLREEAATRQRVGFENRWKQTSFASFAQKREPDADTPEPEAERIRALNSGIDNIRNDAERYAFQASNEEGAADIAIKAANYDFVVRHAFPYMQSEYARVVELNRQLSAKLKDLDAHKPGSDFAGGKTQEQPQEKDLKTEIKKLYRSA